MADHPDAPDAAVLVEEQWGINEEAAERTERLRGEARMLERWFRGLAA